MDRVRVGDDEYEFDFANPSIRDAREIEKQFQGTFSEWAAAVRSGSMMALTCLVYVLEKKAGHAVRFDDIDFRIGDLEIIPEEQPDEEGDGEEANPTETPDSVDSGAAA